MDGLPIEILRRIFLESLPNRDAIDHDSPLSASVSSPLHISHVCRHWRDVTLSFGELWSYLALCLKDGVGPKRLRLAVDIFDSWLERTNGCALNFFFSCDLERDTDVELSNAAQYIIKALLAQQRRWRDVKFIWELSVPSDFSDCGATDMPMLVSLVLNVHRMHRKDFSRPLNHVNIANSVLLEYLELQGILDVELCPKRSFISLEQSHFIFWVDEQRQMMEGAKLCLDLLKATPNLINFCGDFKNMWADIPAPPDSLLDREFECIVHNVQQLTLWDGSGAGIVLDKLTLPSLKFLDYYDQDYDEHGDILRRFFHRSAPPLRILRLTGSCTRERFLVPLLRLFPMLQELSLSSVDDVSPWFFQELTYGIGASASGESVIAPICPTLCSLRLANISDLPDHTEWAIALCAMVERRWEHQKSFKQVQIWAVPDVIEVPHLRQSADMIINVLAQDESNEIWIHGDIEDPLMITRI